MNKKALSPVVASIILIACTVAVSIAVAAWMGAVAIEFVDDAPQPTTFSCNLGQRIGYNNFYFHGVIWNNETKTNTLLIGHYIDGGFTNMQIQLDYTQIEDGQPIFRLGDKTYKITSLMVDEIRFEEVPD